MTKEELRKKLDFGEQNINGVWIGMDYNIYDMCHEYYIDRKQATLEECLDAVNVRKKKLKRIVEPNKKDI